MNKPATNKEPKTEKRKRRPTLVCRFPRLMVYRGGNPILRDLETKVERSS